MNPTEESQTLTTLKLSNLTHEIFDIIIINNISPNNIPENKENRIQLIKDAIKSLHHMNKEEKKAIEHLCSEFSDIFFLEGEKQSCMK